MAADDLRTLKPQQVFAYFADLCAIPRISGHEQAVGAYLMDFARKEGLEARQDAAGSVIIDKPASPVREHSPRVILQGHQDMVPAKRPESTHDFLTDPIIPVIKDGRIYADGTSLGADNGIGIAMALAVLSDKTLEHGPLRAIFTVQEETTMAGAENIDPKELDADYLINIDSEEDGYAYIMSAGSMDMEVSFKAEQVESPDADSAAVELRLVGLAGGHSGTDIHLGRANAIVMLATMLLSQSTEFDFYLQQAQGGTVRNAIPNNAAFTVAAAKDDLHDFKQALLIEFEKFRRLYQDTDPKMRLEIREAAPAARFSFTDTLELLTLIEQLPHGPVRRFPLDPKIVETSCNLGLIKAENGEAVISLMARSLHEFSLDLMADKAASLCFLSDKTDFSSPRREGCWESSADNALINNLRNSYEAVTGRKMQITALHAGLETAAFAAKNPKLQLVSFGPTVDHPHSYAENCDIAAVEAAWETLRRTLAAL